MLFINVLVCLDAQDFDMSSRNPEVITYFHTEALSLLSFIDKSRAVELDGVSNDIFFPKEINSFNFIPFFFSGHKMQEH
jgi:hypothetical protein